jgi:predicted amino acid-binding ACT domain protein
VLSSDYTRRKVITITGSDRSGLVFIHDIIKHMGRREGGWEI